MRDPFLRNLIFRSQGLRWPQSDATIGRIKTHTVLQLQLTATQIPTYKNATENRMGAIVFKGDMPLDEFLTKNKPSSIDSSRNNWVQVRNPNCQSEGNPQTKALCKVEWQKRLTKPASEGRINYDFVKHLAEKYNYKTGKWLVYLPR